MRGSPPAPDSVRGHLFVFVWLSDNRRLLLVFPVLVFLLRFVIIGIVWVPRRHCSADEPRKTAFGEALDHVDLITPADRHWFRKFLG